MAYRYKLTDTGQSSAKYGKCEVCGEHCSEVFYQTEQREYFSPVTNSPALTFADCTNLFGHKNCLITKQKK